ncbi:hypothetical protein GH714_018698 [Hevea brasiliensis]|uniref:Protein DETOXIFICATION n=1 Tax=Hevea brasiliensis TaxID=3981 RepID=A0A6A6MER8_HEVBR|nr:hypothetical protein GH714_018698 [Hevea brasiliensis]
MLTTESSQKYPTMPEVVDELKKMTDIGFPIAAMSLVGYLKNMILVVCLGRLGSLELAGGALAIGFTNITGYSVLSGLAMGMEPLCSQAFGSRNLSVASVTLQRTVVMLLLASLPVGLLWVNLEPLMLALHQDPDITRIARYLSKPRVALATSAIVIQTTSLMYTLPTALSASVSTRVGNELGAGRPGKARLATAVAVGLALLSSLLGWGSARPGIGAGINFYSFYLVGAPVAIVLGFVWKLGFVGLCYGLLAAQIACVVSILTVVYKTDWERESLKAKHLVGKCTDALAHANQALKSDEEEGVGFLGLKIAYTVVDFEK